MIKEPIRGVDIRKRNERLILRLIQEHQQASQSEIAAWTDLKPPTVLRIFTSLEEQKFIMVAKNQKEVQEKKGRKPVYYSLNPSVLYTVGIEFWGISATVVIVDFTHHLVAKKSIPFESDVTGETVISLLINETTALLKEKKISTKRLLGIGIGAPGQVDTKNGQVSFYTRMPGIDEINIIERFSNSFRCPIFINNNCSVITMHEYARGTAKNSHALLSVLIRSGVGGAFLNDGKLFMTANKTTLELGHMSIDMNGRQCECGDLGCLESYLSEPVLKKDLAGIFQFEEIEELNKPILEQDKAVLSLLKEKAVILASSIRNLYYLLNPDTVLIISRAEELSRFFASYSDEYMKKVTKNRDDKKVQIIPLTYSPERAGLGAADLVFNDFYAAT